MKPIKIFCTAIALSLISYASAQEINDTEGYEQGDKQIKAAALGQLFFKDSLLLYSSISWTGISLTGFRLSRSSLALL